MKKYGIELILILSIVFTVLTGCSNSEIMEEDVPKDIVSEEVKIENETVEKIDTIEDYFPFKENTIMEYEGVGNEFAEQKAFFEFIEGNKAQLKIFNPGTVAIKILEYSNGELKETYTEGEFYHIENMLNKAKETNNVLIKEPLKPGTSWTTADGYRRAITAINMDLELPYKNLKVLEVTTELGDGIKTMDYYAKDIGHVATIYKDGDFEVKTLLDEIENSPYETKMVFYYPHYEDFETLYLNKDIPISTNASIEKILGDNFKNPGTDKLIGTISKNTKINSLKLERGNGIVRVDFSKEFLEDMNAGSGLEYEILRSITNTLGDYYRVEKVYISIESKPYASGHFELQEDEYFEVDKNDIGEFRD